MNTTYTINPQRLQKFQDDFAQFGKTDKGGLNRLTLTDEDKQARDLFVALAKQAGCTIKVDAIGNIFARRAGSEPDLPAVLTGSHTDSQPLGGRFDGTYGVLAALEALYSLNDHDIQTRHPIDLVVWTNEEGARFAPAIVGSSVFCGQVALQDALAKTDLDGKTMGEELKRIGYAGVDDFSDYKIHAAIEVHIEQGTILEDSHDLIGAVPGAMGQKWYEVTFTGMAAHAGTTPMTKRRDALLGLSEAVLAINQIGHDENPNGRATVGMTRLSPASRNVIPGEAWFSVEFRHPSEERLLVMDGKLRETLDKIALRYNLQVAIKPILSFAPVYFDQDLVQTIRQTAKELGYPCQDIVSGAGHDACNVNFIAPTAMIFIPCVDGISHNEKEDITPEWANAGAHTLLNTLVKLAS